MINPILLPLQRLNCHDEFVIHCDGFFMPDYWRGDVLEFLGIEKESKPFEARCFTKNREINVANYLPKNTLVFPIELNIKAQRNANQKRISELEELIKIDNMANAVFLSSFNLYDRFKLSPKSTEVFIITMDLGDKFWCVSFLGGQTFCKTTKVFQL